MHATRCAVRVCPRVSARLDRLSSRCRADVGRGRGRAARHASTSTFTASAPNASTSTPVSASAAGRAQDDGAGGLGALGALAGELDGLAPRFELDGGDVRVLAVPAEFYAVLKDMILRAKKRIYLSTLYVGKTEHELIDTIATALDRNPELTVSILTDALRGTREAPATSCASLLAPLVARFGADRVQVRMFHTPNLVGTRKRVLPRRINEGWGLQHMKLYGVDDEVLLSGANLSTDYFTDRQDRYHVFRSRALADFYGRVHDAVGRISFDVRPDGGPAGFELVWPDDAGCASPLADAKAYVKHATTLLAPLIRPSAEGAVASRTKSDKPKTVVYPLFQLAPLLPGTADSPPPSTELPALRLLLQRLSTAPFAPARWTFTAGYFNMTAGVRDMLLSSLQRAPGASGSVQPHGTILTAHPHANGFYGSAGVSGLLPPAYTLLARRFLAHALRLRLGDALSLHEWRRGDFGQPHRWTYHAKGLWVWLPGSEAAENGPALTLVGSSNYTKRSHELDLEANALILTADPELRTRLATEEKHLMEHAGAPVGMDTFQAEERHVSWKVRVALWIVGVVGGAL